jgi:D-alanyl-D-alanine carboxypeptidase
MRLLTRLMLLITVTATATLGAAADVGAAPSSGSEPAGDAVSARLVRVTGPAGSGLPPYVAFIVPVTTERLGASWREGCPVGAAKLRLINLSRVGFDGRVHRGELIVHEDVAFEVAHIFAELYFDRFPVERMETVEKYGADDDLSMQANNTSAFNCRPITGGTAWSNHSYGRAIDVNPVQNPYVTGRHVSPPAGRPYTDRARRAPGMIHAGDAVVRAFVAVGWEWGGAWRSGRDYQHFSASGR